MGCLSFDCPQGNEWDGQENGESAYDHARERHRFLDVASHNPHPYVDLSEGYVAVGPAQSKPRQRREATAGVHPMTNTKKSSTGLPHGRVPVMTCVSAPL